MAKVRTLFECQYCSATYPAWMGQCTSCESWNSLAEQQQEAKPSHKHPRKQTQKPIGISDVVLDTQVRYETGISELDRVLGTGFVRGSVTLLGGEPGIGKSTLSLQLSAMLAKQGLKLMIITGEESVQQIHLRAKRLNALESSILVYSEINMSKILATLAEMQPDVVILDSIQVVYHPEFQSSPGTVGQVRHCANELINWVKDHHSVGVIIGHINKEGSIAGPKVLEHLVDVILYFEGERTQRYRLLRCYKNRYSSTTEVGIFEMLETGLSDIVNPSELFIGDRLVNQPGSVISAISEGNRILVIEVQALVVSTGYGMAKRNFVGVNPHRANLLSATVEKSLNMPLHAKDIFLNIIGGLKIDEPALDLAVVLAMVSSYHDRPVGKTVSAVGEIGLTGEVRAVPKLELRLAELAKMGFTQCYIPESSRAVITPPKKMTLIYCQQIHDMVKQFLTETHETT